MRQTGNRWKLTHRTGGVAAFTPISLSPAVWYDPSDLSTLFQTDGTTPAVVDGAVGKMLDKSGNGRHVIQATGTKQPILRQSGSVYYLDFDGADDFLRLAGFTVNQPDTHIVGVLIQANAATGGNIHDGGGGANRQLFGSTSGNAYRMYGGTDTNGGTRDTTTPHTLLAFFNGASSTLKVDSTTVIATNAGALADSNGITIGADNGGLGPFDGYYYGGMIVPRALTGSEETSLRSYYAAKMGP